MSQQLDDDELFCGKCIKWILAQIGVQLIGIVGSSIQQIHSPLLPLPIPTRHPHKFENILPIYHLEWKMHKAHMSRQYRLMTIDPNCWGKKVVCLLYIWPRSLACKEPTYWNANLYPDLDPVYSKNIKTFCI